MFDMMIRVARSTKDIEIAKRSIDVMGLQRDIQNGVPIHEAVARHPMALGSGFGAALKNTAPVEKSEWVAPSEDGPPGHFMDQRGMPHFPPAPSVINMPPTARQGQSVTDAQGNEIATDVGGGRIIQKPKPAPEGKMTDQNRIKLTERYKERAKLTDEMSGIDWESKQKAGLFEKGAVFEKMFADKTAKAAQLDREIAELEGGAAPVAASSIGATGAINPLPASKAELVVGKLYDTKHGVGRWTGTAFEKVQVK